MTLAGGRGGRVRKPPAGEEVCNARSRSDRSNRNRDRGRYNDVSLDEHFTTEVAPGQRLRLAQRSEAAWEEMRHEVGAANGDAVVDSVKSVLCLTTDFFFAGSSTPAAGEDGEEIDELRPRFQKRIMLVRARHRRKVVHAMMVALPSKEPVRVA